MFSFSGSRARSSAWRRESGTSQESADEELGFSPPQPSTHQSDDATPQPSPTMSFTEVISTTRSAHSTRSRASSIISTGTKTSITTLPQSAEVSHQPPLLPSSHPETHRGPIDVVLGQRNFRITARPGSILSISSFDHSTLPPYSETAPPSHPAPLPTSDNNGSFRPEILAPSPRRPTTSDTNTTVRPSDLSPLQTSISASSLPTSTSTLDTSGSAVAGSDPSSLANTISRTPSPPSPPLSPMSSSTNALSAHYTSVVRTLDSQHSAELAALRQSHAAALAQTRHDIDTAYRAEFRQRAARSEANAARVAAETRAEAQAEFEPKIAGLEARLREKEREAEELRASLADEAGRRDAEVRRARNGVEDVWEGRWKDRMRLAEEQVRSAWEDSERVVRAWEGVVAANWPEAVGGVRDEVRRVLAAGPPAPAGAERKRIGDGR